MKLCKYHNAMTSSWENGNGKAEELVKPSNCEWCIINREIIESAGGPEKFLEEFYNKLEESIKK